MPAYFSIDFQYQKTDIHESVVEDFFSKLLECGLTYKSGYWHSEKDGLDEILLWNQKKLAEDFQLGYTEHYTHDYKQMLFAFHDFSEVRLILHNSTESNSFSFYLVIPEDDFVIYEEKTGKTKRLEKRMDIVKNLALHMWQIGNMCCIQTSWECSDLVTDYADIIEGAEPLIEPFSIVPQNTYNVSWECTYKNVEGNGVLLENDDNWYYI